MKKQLQHNTNTSEVLKGLGYSSGQRVVLKRNRVAIIPIEDFQMLEALEDRIDVEESKKALAEGKGTPWEKIKHEFGF
jgi:hypothetical protein